MWLCWNCWYSFWFLRHFCGFCLIDWDLNISNSEISSCSSHGLQIIYHIGILQQSFKRFSPEQRIFCWEQKLAPAAVGDAVDQRAGGHLAAALAATISIFSIILKFGSRDQVPFKLRIISRSAPNGHFWFSRRWIKQQVQLTPGAASLVF